MSKVLSDERTPLLSTNLDNAERQRFTKRPVTPIVARSMKPLVILFVLYGMQPLVYELVFPFINQMLVETGVVDNPERVGYYSGFIESCYSLMSFIAILPCGYLSDTFGRKPIILVSILSLAISTSFFGVSRTYLSMIISRCLAGTAGGAMSAIKVMVGELTDKTSQGTVFSWLSISYRIGQVLGNPLGGYLAHPERHLALFRTPFWYQYPFALPCFISASIATVVVVMGYFHLEEVRQHRKQRMPCHQTCRTKMKRHPHSRQTSADDHSFPSSTQEERLQAVLGNVNSRKSPLKSVLSPTIISLLSSTIGMSLLNEIIFSLYPLFAFTSIEAGGLGAGEAVIGTHMAIRSLLPIPLMLFYPLIERRLGTVRTYQLVVSTFPIVVLFFPALNQLARANSDVRTLNAALFVYFFAWSWCCLAWPCSAIMVNDAAPSADYLATINNISQMSIVLPQAIAPVLATSMFAASINSPLLSGNMIWVVLLMFSLVVTLHSYTLRQPTTDWRVENI